MTIGSELRRYREQSGLSLRKVAESAGYAGASSLQKFFEPTYDPAYLSGEIARKLSKAMHGKGDPPVDGADILAMAGVTGASSETMLNFRDVANEAIALLRDKRIPADVRAMAAVELLQQAL